MHKNAVVNALSSGQGKKSRTWLYLRAFMLAWRFTLKNKCRNALRRLTVPRASLENT